MPSPPLQTSAHTPQSVFLTLLTPAPEQWLNVTDGLDHTADTSSALKNLPRTSIKFKNVHFCSFLSCKKTGLDVFLLSSVSQQNQQFQVSSAAPPAPACCQQEKLHFRSAEAGENLKALHCRIQKPPHKPEHQHQH